MLLGVSWQAPRALVMSSKVPFSEGQVLIVGQDHTKFVVPTYLYTTNLVWSRS